MLYSPSGYLRPLLIHDTHLEGPSDGIQVAIYLGLQGECCLSYPMEIPIGRERESSMHFHLLQRGHAVRESPSPSNIYPTLSTFPICDLRLYSTFTNW